MVVRGVRLVGLVVRAAPAVGVRSASVERADVPVLPASVGRVTTTLPFVDGERAAAADRRRRPSRRPSSARAVTPESASEPVPLQTSVVPAPGAQLTAAAGGVRSILTVGAGGVSLPAPSTARKVTVDGAVGVDGVAAADTARPRRRRAPRSASAGRSRRRRPRRCRRPACCARRRRRSPRSASGAVLSMPIVSVAPVGHVAGDVDDAGLERVRARGRDRDRRAS